MEEDFQEDFFSFPARKINQGWQVKRTPPDQRTNTYNIVGVCPICKREHYIAFYQNGCPPQDWNLLKKRVFSELKICTCGCYMTKEPIRCY